MREVIGYCAREEKTHEQVIGWGDCYCDLDVYRKLNRSGGAAAPFTEVAVMPLLKAANPIGSMGYEASQEIVQDRPRVLCVCSGA